MSAVVVPLFGQEPSLADRLKVRRAYRKRVAELAADYVSNDFLASCRGIDIGIEDALPLFVAAMRKQLRKSGFLLKGR
jgi:hypothetical protein